MLCYKLLVQRILKLKGLVRKKCSCIKDIWLVSSSKQWSLILTSVLAWFLELKELSMEKRDTTISLSVKYLEMEYLYLNYSPKGQERMFCYITLMIISILQSIINYSLNREVKIPPEKFALHYLASILTSQFEFLS